MEVENVARQVTNPMFENLHKNGGFREPVAKRAKMASQLQVIPTQASKRKSFAVDEIQQCLFNTTSVRPVNMQHFLAKRQENTCFWCDAGSANPNFHCPTHEQNKPTFLHTSKLPLALRSLPPEVKLCASSIPGAGYGICAMRTIPAGAWIGPYEGKFLKPEELSSSTDTSYMWEIFKDGKLAGFVDGRDEKIASWMRFVRCARHKKEQNLFAFQYLGKIYYRSFKAILPGEEMLVWYDEKYPQYLGIPSALFDLGSVSANGPRSPPEKSGTVIPQARETVSVETNQLPPTPPSSVPSPSSPLSPESHQLNSPAKAVNGVPLIGLQREVPYAFDFSSVSHNPQSPPLPSPESLRSNTSSPNNSEDGHHTPVKPKHSVFSNVPELSLWKCGQCNKSFPQRTMLQVHVCNESPNKPYQCGHCMLSFSHPAELRAHAVSHASKKPFKCGYCSRAFAGATTLNNHIRTHTGEKPFVCDKCGKNFTQGSQLSRHQRIPGDCVPEA